MIDLLNRHSALKLLRTYTMLSSTSKKNPSDKKLIAVAIFIILGRLFLIAGFAFLISLFLYSYPPYLWRIISAIVVGITMIALASIWANDNAAKTFGGLIHHSLTISFVLGLFFILRTHLTQENLQLTVTEITVIFLSGVFLMSYFVLYKKFYKKP